jgi:hypothetical protein
MKKNSKKSTPEKTIQGAPAVMEGFDNMMRRSFKEEARRQFSVQPQTNPHRLSKDYTKNFDDIDWHRNKQ